MTYDKIITILFLSFWFVFPIGMFISAIIQDREEKHWPQNKNKAQDLQDQLEDPIDEDIDLYVNAPRKGHHPPHLSSKPASYLDHKLTESNYYSADI